MLKMQLGSAIRLVGVSEYFQRVSNKLLHGHNLLLLFFVGILWPAFLIIYYGLGGAISGSGIALWTECGLNSLKLVFLSGALALIMGAGCAYFMTFYDFWGKRILQFIIPLPLAIPSFFIAFSYGGFLEYGGILHKFLKLLFFWKSDVGYNLGFRNIIGASFIMGLSFYPYVYISSIVAFDRVVQPAIVARSVGKSKLSVFMQVILPPSVLFILSGLLLACMEILSDFGVVHEMSLDTMTFGIYREWFLRDNLSGAIRISAVLLMVSMLMAIASRRVGGEENNKVIRGQSFVGGLYGHSILAQGFCFAVCLCGFFIPLSMLVYWSFQSSESFLSWHHIICLVNTCTLSMVTALIVSLLAFALMFLICNSAGSGRIAIMCESCSSLVNFGYAVPGIIIALGFVLGLGWFGSSVVPLFMGHEILLLGTMFALIYAYTVRFFAIPFRMFGGIISNFDRSVLYVARILGGGKLKALTNVYIPFMSKGLLWCFVVLFIDISKELPITLILRPFNFETLSTHIFDMVADERVIDASVPALFLICFMLCSMFLVIYCADRHSNR